MVTAKLSVLHEDLVRLGKGPPNATLTIALLKHVVSVAGDVHPHDFLEAASRDRFLEVRERLEQYASRGGGDEGGIRGDAQLMAQIIQILIEQPKPRNESAFSWIGDKKLRSILDRDHTEAVSLLSGHCYKSCIVMCGSILEAVLYAVLREDPDWVKGRPSCLPQKNIGSKSSPDWQPRDISSNAEEDQWKLDDLAKCCCAHGVLEKSREGTLTDVLRQPRNLIHPTVETRGKHGVSLEQAKASLSVLELILHDLGTRKRPWHP